MSKMKTKKIDAALAIHSEGRLILGRDRIKLLEAVAKHGSITKAAKTLGFSYKTAWDAVNAINNLTPTPAFMTSAGGRSGGGAEVTEQGRRLIAAFNRLEEKIARVSAVIADERLSDADDFLLWSLGMSISARNVFRAEVTQVRRWPVDVEVTLRLSDDDMMSSIVTNAAADELGLESGRKALALVKSSFVALSSARTHNSGGRNSFIGVVKRRVDAERNSEVLLDIGCGKTITSVGPRERVESLNLKEGDEATATFDAANVLLAAESA